MTCLFHLANFLRLPPFISFGDCFFVFPLGTLSAPSGYSPLLSRVFLGTAVSPSPAAPLCWAVCLPPREQIGHEGLCVQGLGGRCSVPALGVVTPQQPGHWSGWAPIPSFEPVGPSSPAADQSVHPPVVSGVGAQAADLVVHQAGFRCVLGLLIQCSQSRGWGPKGTRGHGCCREFSKQLLSTSILPFSFQEIPPIQAPLSKQAPGLSQPSLALSHESCSRHCSPAGGFSRPGPCSGPRDLIVLKHSSYHLIFQCPLQSLVSDLWICWNTVGCLLCSSDQLGVSLVPRGSGLLSHLSCCHLLILIPTHSWLINWSLPISTFGLLLSVLPWAQHCSYSSWWHHTLAIRLLMH